MGGAILNSPATSGWQRFLVAIKVTALRITLWFSPRPTAHAIRRLFVETGSARAARQLADAPKNVLASLDQAYGQHEDCRLDVYLPSSATASESSLPVVIWIHGGAFVGGTKDEYAGYFRMLASHGVVVVGPRYSLAPESSYPVATRQLMSAVGWVVANAERFHIDPKRIVFAGDSAGAQLAAQLAILITSPAYAELVGIRPTIPPTGLRGVALCCGIYDLTQLSDDSPYRPLYKAVGWAYSGTRDYRKNAAFLDVVSVLSHVTDAFPPVFITAGNADPLEGQSRSLADSLAKFDVEVEALFYPEDHEPPLPHEYQLDLELEDGRVAFNRLVTFFERVTDIG